MDKITLKNIKYIDAGAGSGKTYKLTHLLSDLLKDGKVNPSQVIATTYTRAAAAEIKDRARKVLIEAGRYEEAAQLDNAAIGTVHSVAQMLIGRYWDALGTTPTQLVISEEDSRLYRNQSLAAMLGNKDYTEQRDKLDLYFHHFDPKKSDEDGQPKSNPEFWVEDLESIVNKITYYGLTDEDIEKSIRESMESIDNIFDNEDSDPTDEKWQEMLAHAIETMKDYVQGSEKSDDKKCKKHIRSLEKLDSELLYCSIVKLYSEINTSADLNKPWKGFYEDRHTLDKRQLEVWLRSRRFGAILKDCVQAMFELAKAWMKEYEAFKRQHGVIDYDDMEKGLLNLLNDEKVSKDIAQTYRLVLVDEFQDCNPIQLKIFSRLSEIVAENKVLEQSSIWVGDPKQAIYGFRGSDTELVNRVARHFPAIGEPANQDGLIHESLKHSYRSRKGLVDLVNHLFGDVLEGNEKPIFEGMTKLEATRNDVGGLLPVLEHWRFEDDGNDAKSFYQNQALAVKRMIESGAHRIVPKGETEGLRSIEYKDVAILCRRKSEVRQAADALKDWNVPVSAPETDIFDRAEVQLLLSLLFLSEPKTAYQKHEWATVWRLWNDLSTEDVLMNRLEYVRKLEGTGDEWLKDEASLARVRSAIKHAMGKGISSRLAIFIHELDLYDCIRKWGDAETRYQNLQTLQTTAQQFESRCEALDNEASAQEFSLYLQEVELQPSKDMTSNTVKVMTYHGSKGLEWPVVLLDSLYKREVDEDKIVERGFWGVHEEKEAADDQVILPPYHISYIPKPVNNKCQILTDSGIKETELFKHAEQQTREEAQRLLYVGMTRARDYLVLTIYGGKTDFKWLNDIGMNISYFGVDAQIFPAINPKAPTAPKVPGEKARPSSWDKYNRELAEYNEAMKAYEERKAFFEQHLDDVSNAKPCRLHKLSNDLLDNPRKYVLPSTLSKSKDKAVVGEPIGIFEDFKEEITLKNVQNSVFGTCVHNIFAACPSKGEEPTEAERSEFVSITRDILQNYELEGAVKDPSKLAHSLYALYDYLKKEYGPATGIVHEYPFNFPVPDSMKTVDGQVMKGEIDLIWQTEEGDIVVDFKNNMGDIAGLNTPGAANYAGNHYVHQLRAYRSILEKAGRSVRATLLYYDILGVVVPID